MNVRRVVTGHDAHGKAVIVDDGVVEPTTVTLSPTVYHELWRADSHPTLPDAGVNGPRTTFFPRSEATGSSCSPFLPATAAPTSKASTSKPVCASFKRSSPAS
jgi:hypothetical protein